MYSRFIHVAVISFLGVHSIAVKAPMPWDMCIRMFTAEIFTTGKKGGGGKKRKKEKKLEVPWMLVNWKRHGIPHNCRRMQEHCDS